MSEYTPGPWSIHHESITNTVSIGSDECGRLVCRLNKGTDEDKANAYLINSSPLMLEALEEIQQMMNVIGPKLDEATASVYRSTMAKVSYAIGSAKGEFWK